MRGGGHGHGPERFADEYCGRSRIRSRSPSETAPIAVALDAVRSRIARGYKDRRLHHLAAKARSNSRLAMSKYHTTADRAPGRRDVRPMMPGASRSLLGRQQARSSAIVRGFMPSVLDRIHSAETGLAIWQRFTRLNLLISASAVLTRPPFTLTVADTPDMAARRLCHDLLLFHWPLYADLRRLAARFAALSASPVVRMRLEHVIDNSCRKFHVDAVGLRLLCTYAGPGTEWMAPGGEIRRMTTMEVAVFKGSAFPGAGPRVPHRSPPLSAGAFVGHSRLVLCIDTVS